MYKRMYNITFQYASWTTRNKTSLDIVHVSYYVELFGVICFKLNLCVPYIQGKLILFNEQYTILTNACFCNVQSSLDIILLAIERYYKPPCLR